MGQSPKSMFTGTIELGLVNIPITLGKAVGDEREGSLKQVCRCHQKPIDARWRCAVSHEYTTDTVAAVQVGDDEWRLIDEAEMQQIEEATKSKILTVLDVQPTSKLPLMYAYGTYYVRHDAKSKMRPDAMATLVASMTKNHYGLVTKWGNSAKEKLCFITAESGVLVLRLIPFWENIRVASSAEREHFKGKVQPKNVEKMDELLNAFRNPDGFKYAEYADAAIQLRQNAIERILSGEEPKPLPAPPKLDEPLEIEKMIDLAIAEARS
jgi:non-homologous end joining protein Ku